MPVPDPPPAYTSTVALGFVATDDDLRLPEYTFPSKFNVGGKLTDSPLVGVPSIKGHLALLRAFAELKEKVETTTFDTPFEPKDAEAKWKWFVEMAAERFDRWCLSLSPKASQLPLEGVLPPLDVLMVWHSYMLNPRWYAEDAQRIATCKPLLALGDVFGRELPRLPALLESVPSEVRVAMFSDRVLLPYDPFESALVNPEKRIKCPRCRLNILVPCMIPEGTGYIQPGFSVQCPRQDCLAITKESLCARKLAENISREGEGPDTFLPGTVFTESRASTQRTSDDIIWVVRNAHTHSLKTRCERGVNEELCARILADTHYSMPELRARLSRNKLVGRIMSAHASPMLYSVDLVGAVLRQGSFVGKMTGLGWTSPGFFDTQEDETVLSHAIARYHAFLDLLSSSPTSFFVPTLDIDLIWHTHQLWSSKYEQDCGAYVGRFIDHDDKVDGVKLSSSFDVTCRAWKGRFGVPYTYCGCPLPGDTIGKRLSRFVFSTTSKSSEEPGPSDLVPLPDRPDHVAATHASEHNSIQFQARNDRVYKKSESAWRDHQGKMVKRVEKQEEGRGKGKGKKESMAAQCGYGLPFILPVPLMLGAGVPGGVVVDHGGACGNGNGIPKIPIDVK